MNNLTKRYKTILFGDIGVLVIVLIALLFAFLIGHGAKNIPAILWYLFEATIGVTFGLCLLGMVFGIRAELKKYGMKIWFNICLEAILIFLFFFAILYFQHKTITWLPLIGGSLFGVSLKWTAFYLNHY